MFRTRFFITSSPTNTIACQDHTRPTLKNAGVTQFGSGWVWLILKDSRLAIIQVANAETPLAMGAKPLLVADVWEHAYYLDYQNRRPDFLQAFLDHLVNWDFVNSNLE
jgi:superoxide dismutase, Fe-Mn family